MYGSCGSTTGSPVYTNVVVNGAKSVSSVSGCVPATHIRGLSSNGLINGYLANISLDATAQSSDQDATIGLDNSNITPSGTGVTTHAFTLGGSVPACLTSNAPRKLVARPSCSCEGWASLPDQTHPHHSKAPQPFSQSADEIVRRHKVACMISCHCPAPHPRHRAVFATTPDQNPRRCKRRPPPASARYVALIGGVPLTFRIVLLIRLAAFPSRNICVATGPRTPEKTTAPNPHSSNARL